MSITTGKKARKIWGTRFAAKGNKRKTQRKHFATPDCKVCDLPNGEAAYALARKLGFPAPVDISEHPYKFEDALARDW